MSNSLRLLLPFTRCRPEKGAKKYNGTTDAKRARCSRHKHYSEEEDMKTLQSFAQLSLVIVGSMLIAGPVSATGIRDYHDRGGFDFSFLKSNGQFRNKIPGAAAHSDWLENLEGRINKDDAEHKFSGFSLFGKNKDYSRGKRVGHEGPLNFLFGTSDGKKHEGHFKRLLENNPRYADHLVGFDGSERGLELVAKKIISHKSPGSSSVVPIPAAAWLMLSGLSVLGWRGKKQATKNPLDAQ